MRLSRVQEQAARPRRISTVLTILLGLNFGVALLIAQYVVETSIRAAVGTAAMPLRSPSTSGCSRNTVRTWDAKNIQAFATLPAEAAPAAPMRSNSDWMSAALSSEGVW